jgi:putative RNA 2'-phosphotransferase
MDKRLVKTSKFLSLVLRHRPELIGITLDRAGWVGVEELLEAAARHGVRLTREELLRVVRENDKRRFALGDDGRTIRASQGHSVGVELGYEPAEPPPALYHGTTARNLPSIRERGLTRGARHHVHLSADAETARSVGARRGRPVVLGVRAAEMRGAGHEFFRADNGVWLTEGVPPRYIEFSETDS